jgi:uncharacterized protein YraI
MPASVTVQAVCGIKGLMFDTEPSETEMTRQHEKLLIATLAGLMIVFAAAFAVTPTLAAGYSVDMTARVSGVAEWDVLNVRKWPAHYSQQVGALDPDTYVWVERCIILDNASDWCRVERGETSGWVNSRYLMPIDPYSMGDL